MFDTVTLPVWLFALIILFAAVTALSHVFIPPVRWFLRRRLERAVTRLNERLTVPIHPLKLLRRQDMILRLSYDPVVLEAVAQHAREEGIREDVAHSTAKRYAREIVPSFSATAYFGFATRVARWLSTRLYDVHVTRAEGGETRPDETVVFVMNHRSNMDYVLVTYLAADRSALSYAVGEWARIWPISRLLRGMGAYFIRRRSRNPLYRRVLARYVQIATAGGVAQAIFPEGGLSLNGAVGPAKLGLFSYIVDGYVENGREIAFVPVSLNYDRVLEDNILVSADRAGNRRFRGSFVTGSAFVLRWLWRRMTGKVRRFGVAAVSFGAPIRLSDFGATPDTKALARQVMGAIAANVPVLAAPMVAASVLGGARTRDTVVADVARMRTELEARGVPVCIPEEQTEDAVDRALSLYVLRHVLTLTDGQIALLDRSETILPFYAASVPELNAAAQEVRPEPDVTGT
ncbi:Glycerol-3-phosphate acyltransferase [Rhodobacteraceae bacterium THAF1]|uniref:1-acyl-sn-glycerol-3-phosphate acyltransferase n=1 Tax=Palleronia sp. THAF1 TaxID=2587842 RepID=UPI000F3B78DD|nr:1-acyl-sn-glycerol-3-phosphate acyltransferase [Palleronia sp. THAF1]QFU07867.1 Glycerol-3-phosphate acyltransferase [Palleronia sp. THAF1]VDC25701.1 Glycerol-3-phosphate acyltransferase [Rhodobacteraceae bacterium THAF1]